MALKNTTKTKTKGKTKEKVTKPKPKAIPGKSNTISKCPVYKPNIYLDDGQIPKNITNKVGDKVQLVVTGKVVSTSERQDGKGKSKSMSIEIDKISNK